MLDPLRFALQLARVVDLLRNAAAAANDGVQTILPLAELAAQQSATLRMGGGMLSVEGVAVPAELPFIPDLMNQMTAHDVAAIFIAHNASADELLRLASALAGHGRTATGTSTSESLHDAVDVRVVDTAGERAAAARRGAPIGTVPDMPDIARPNESAAAGPAAPSAAQPLLELVLQRLRKPAARDPFAALELATAGIHEAVAADRKRDVVEALGAIIRQEAALPEGHLRGLYAIALRQLLGREVLRSLGWLLLDPLYQAEVMRIMHRAGAAASEHLLALLIEAPTFAERRALLQALRALREGDEHVVSLLNHPEWYVVRNVADLAGELGVESAIGRLGEAVEHADPRVRKSAGVALARIAAPAAARHLRRALRDADGGVRMEVAKALGGRGLAGLAPTVITILDEEQDPAVKAELYRALGRIGSPEAVQFLCKAAESGGLLVGRKSAETRIAAVHGLALAGGDAARAELQRLSQDGDKAVRAAVKHALDQLRPPRKSRPKV